MITDECYIRMGKEAFNPEKSSSKECPWVMCSETNKRIGLWTTGWYDAKNEWVQEKRKQKEEIYERIYLLFNIMEDGTIKFKSGTTDKELTLNFFKGIRKNDGRVFILDSSSIKRVMKEEDL